MANTTLNVSLQKASQQISQRIRLGRQIAKSREKPETVDIRFLNSLSDSLKKWDDYNSTFLRKLFSDESVADKYDAAISFTTYSSISDYSKKLSSFYRIKMRELNSIKERMKLYSSFTQATSTVVSSITPPGNKVFIVHGHDDATKETVARFLEKLDLDVVILHEKPDKGNTIIEKLEANSSEVDIGYAVVLLTPDDVGAAKSKINKSGSDLPLLDRARQNVVFELGYFISKLGRPRVHALHVEGVELPSDYHGVLYTPLDKAGSWKLKIAREIKAAGIHLDLNKAL